MTKDPARQPDVGGMLASAESSSSARVEDLVPIVYEELRALAHRHLARERDGHSLQTTALVHEAYLRLTGHTQVTARGRAYFFAAAARAMRQVLIDRARRRAAAKRGGGTTVIDFDGDVPATDAYAEHLLGLDRVLVELEVHAPRQARVVECRFFAGLSVEETAATLDVSPRTVKSDWAVARAWLFNALGGDGT